MGFADRKSYSEKIVNDLKAELGSCEKLDKNLGIVVTGSFGRDEASEESDMDWFIISVDDLSEDKINLIQSVVAEIINKYVSNNVGNTGTFGGVVTKSEILENFGGDRDSNQSFTRRILYLLESKWLLNEALYTEVKTDILKKYIKDDSPDDGINRFMLNDVIRYYRTICTDYEFKVHESGKSWGVRKIKLKFSRKLLYFSGLITIASTINYTRDEKIEKTLALLALSPLDRIEHLVGADFFTKILSYYELFLQEISKPDVRRELESVDRLARHKSLKYRELKNMSHHFGLALEHCLQSEFTSSHPIHAAIVF